MIVSTWNIWGWFISSIDNQSDYNIENINYFIDELKNISPDIICLQEVHLSKNNNQTNIIAKALWFNYIEFETISDSHLKDWENLAISVISKFPIIDSKYHKLINPNLEFIWNWKKAFSHDKWFLDVKINYDNKIVRVLSWHMVPFRKFWKDFLSNEFIEIRNQIEKTILLDSTNTIVCADMNFEEIYKLIPNVFSSWFKFILDDIPTTPKNRKYDKIIISGDFEFKSSKIINWSADHYLCFADIEFKN